MNLAQILEKFKSGPKPFALPGISHSLEASILAQAFSTSPARGIVRITRDAAEALRFKGDLDFFLREKGKGEALYLPSEETTPYLPIISAQETMPARLTALFQIHRKQSMILILPIEALLRRYPDPAKLFEANLTLKRGQKIRRDLLIGWLVENGYTPVPLVEDRGSCAWRGGILDIFSPQLPRPVRVELDGDEMASLRFFDASSQLSLGEVQEIECIPSHEIRFSKDIKAQALPKIRYLAQEAGLPGHQKRELLGQLGENQYIAGIDAFLPVFCALTSLWKILPEETIWASPPWEELQGPVRAVWETWQKAQERCQGVQRIITPKELLAPSDELEINLKERVTLFVGTPLREKIPEISLRVEGAKTLTPEILSDYAKVGLQILACAHNETEQKRVIRFFESHSLNIPVRIGNLSSGFVWWDEKMAILTQEEIFGEKISRPSASGPPEKLAKGALSSFTDLAKGDLLVHERHGIGKFLGLTHLKVAGGEGDFLLVEYLGEAKLYVPIYGLNALQRYVGPGRGTPTLDRLGGFRFAKAKGRALRNSFQVARGLLMIHAERELKSGFAFPPLDSMDEEFANHFPYEETPDQTHAIEDVFRDMMNSKPMDRLICGDVGFGKTEVALRATFKTVTTGKQVAFVVPTTVLALQHYENFQSRFSPHAISVEMLSRFRNPTRQKEILKDLATGRTDVVIGTHRLLMKDVAFKDLGLMILDEEHRFGVKQKERLKKFRATVDVLSLSATPIPRTMHMSLIGLKDLSIIETPPANRLAIRTYIVPLDEATIQQAISLELARQGQVFFIHNRIATIDGVYKTVARLFPEAKMAIAHGGQSKEILERTMIDFLHQKIRILISTAIVESGLDLPNANTILIDRADMFGLAELYQLRGRVGRAAKQAHCYLLVSDLESLTDEARLRLTILSRYTELGSGFQIASRDLELRGAGNLLGAEQSGFVEAIGYEMYTKLLAKAIRELKGDQTPEEIEPELHFKIAAHIPQEYVPEPHLRLDLYKRLSHVSREEELQTFERELRDRFGPIPLKANLLFEVVRCKILCQRLRIKDLRYAVGKLTLDFDPTTPLRQGGKLIFDLPSKDPQTGILEVKNFLLHLSRNYS